MTYYTVKHMAALTGVSIRTLRFYDKIDLLKPAYYGDNGYRYYEKQQLFALKQIIFLRELDLSLQEIKESLSYSLNDNIIQLELHQFKLEQKLLRTQQQITTLNSTIKHLQYKKKCRARNLYAEFEIENLSLYDQIAINFLGSSAINLINKRKKATIVWNDTAWYDLAYRWNNLLSNLTESLKKGVAVTAKRNMILMQQLHEIFVQLYQPTKDEFLLICQLNFNHAEYKKQYDFYHLHLAEYLQKSMQYFSATIL